MHVLDDWTKEYTDTTGTTVNLVLAGAVPGFATFSANSNITNGTTVYYVLKNGSNLEHGIGTWNTGNTLSRTTPIKTLVAGTLDDTTPARITLVGRSEVMILATSQVFTDIFASPSAIGTTTPAAGTFTSLTSTGNATLGDAAATDTHTVNGATVVNANSANAALTINQIGAGNALLVEDSSSPDATATGIDNNGNIFVGNTASPDLINPSNGTLGINKISLQGTGTLSSSIASVIYAAAATTTFAGFFSLGRSNTNTVGANAIVSSGDLLGGIAWHGNDGVQQQLSAKIAAYVDGTPGAGDMPGRLSFLTSADGSVVPAERFRITSAGDVAVAATVKFYFDGVAATGNTYISETSADNLKIFAGGSERANFNSTGIGFYGSAPVAKPSITGSRGGNAALASLLTALASQGLITDSTTA